MARGAVFSSELLDGAVPPQPGVAATLPTPRAAPAGRAPPLSPHPSRPGNAWRQPACEFSASSPPLATPPRYAPAPPLRPRFPRRGASHPATPASASPLNLMNLGGCLSAGGSGSALALPDIAPWCGRCGLPRMGAALPCAADPARHCPLAAMPSDAGRVTQALRVGEGAYA